VDHRVLSRTGVSVSKMCLGAMMFGSWGSADHDDSIRIIHAALEAGINFVDSADVYGAGESEEIVGKALNGRRDDVILPTKFFNPMGEDPNRRGGSRRWIIQAVEESLRRLQTNWIDLYQITAPIRTPTSRRRCRRSPISSTRARSATSATRPSPPVGSSRPNGSRVNVICSASSQSSPPTRSSYWRRARGRFLSPPCHPLEWEGAVGWSEKTPYRERLTVDPRYPAAASARGRLRSCVHPRLPATSSTSLGCSSTRMLSA
jgi:hypothetical protein